MRSARPLLLLALLATSGSLACGRAREADPPVADPPVASEPAPATSADPCETALERVRTAPRPATATTAQLRGARRAVDRATRVASSRAGRFAIDGVVTVGGGVRLRYAVTGARTPGAGSDGNGGSSTARLTWKGAASLALPDADLRIRRDTLQVREDGRPWRSLGSASGISLDVGRELLTHDFLLRATASSSAGGHRVVRLDAPVAELRAYATNERRGPVTQLLGAARALRIDAHVRSGTLVGDSFQLVTTVPAGLVEGIPAGRVTIDGTTGYCVSGRASTSARSGA